MSTDGARLFLTVTMMHPEKRDGYRMENKGDDAVSFRGTELLEIFLAPRGRGEGYFHFALEPGGTSYDNAMGLEATDFTSGWEHRVEVLEDRWVAHVTIPFKGVDLPEGLKPGDRFAMNVCRVTDGPVSHQVWSPTGPSFLSPEAFAEVIVGSYAAAATKELSELEKSVGSGKSHAAEFEKLRQAAAEVKDAGSWIAFDESLRKLRIAVQSAALADEGLILWEVNPWDLPDANALPAPADKRVAELTLEAFQGEHLSRALAVGNTKGQAISFVRVVPGHLDEASRTNRRGPVLRRELIDASTGKTLPLADHLKLFEAQEIQLTGQIQRDVLKELRHEDALAVPRGGNSVLWIEVDTTGMPPGEWTTTLDLRAMADQKSALQIPLTIRVLPAEMPQGPRPIVNAWVMDPYRPQDKWSLFGGRAPFQYETDTYLKLLRDFDVNAPQILPYYLNPESIKYDQEGRAVSGPDLSRLEPWIKDFGPEAFYILQMHHSNWPAELGGGPNPGDVQRENFAFFIGQVRKFFEERGVSVENFAWFVEDEPSESRVANVIAAGKLFLEADPEQRRFVTVYSGAQPGVMERIAPYVNLWVPKFNMRPDQEAVLALEKAEGNNRFFSYMVHGRRTSPYRGIRSMGIEAFSRGYEGLGLWSLGAIASHYGTSLWNDDPDEPGTKGPVRKYSLLYEGEEGPVYSVRLMGWRMGIQDYRLLEWATALAGKNPDHPAAKPVHVALDQLIKGGWRAPGALDAAWNKLRPKLVELQATTPATSLSVPQNSPSSPPPNKPQP